MEETDFQNQLEQNDLKDSNVSAEICLVGALAKNLDNMVNYAPFMRSKYDFTDETVKFFYENLEIYYTKFSQTLDETKLNVFMTQEHDRAERYKKFKGWKTLCRFMSLADEKDIKNYFDIVKKYSLIREYGRHGFPVKKILASKNFAKWSPNDVYRVIRTKADQINTVINAGEEAVDLTDKTSAQVDSYLVKPNFGLEYPWQMYNDYFLGLREGKILFEGFLSNTGKTRKLVMLAAWIALVKGKDFFLMSNEMDEVDLRNCLITTVVNNEEFQKLHGVKLQKPEKEIVLGIYHDKNGNIISRNSKESNEEFIDRIKKNSEEYWQIKKVTDWIDDPNRGGKVLFKDIGDDYSPQRVEFELRKAKMVQNITYYGYDTLKGYNTDDWSQIKQFATRLKEVTKELKMSGTAVFQLTDDTVFTDIFDLSSNNIANAKQIKYITDSLTLGKKIDKEDYKKYQMVVEDEEWGEQLEENLSYNKEYIGIKIDKNRSGNKNNLMLFEINLDLNVWKNVGALIKNTRY